MSKPRSYFKVTDSDGRIILDNTAEQKKVISNESAAIITKLLETVVESGTASGLITLNEKVNVAGKTGTTQNNSDRLFVGYTPELLCGAWFGYEYPKNLDAFGGNFAAIFFDDVMNKIYSETSYANGKKSFILPHGVQKLTFDKSTGNLLSYGDEGIELEEGYFAINR